jgi:hypothetical protein
MTTTACIKTSAPEDRQAIVQRQIGVMEHVRKSHAVTSHHEPLFLVRRDDIDHAGS